LVIAIALGGGVDALSRPLPLDYKNGEYRRHLTRAEKATLTAGQPVEKTHKASQSIWRTYYDEGPLRVTPAANGGYHFAPHGEWKRQTTKGEVEALFAPGAKPGQDYWHQLRADRQRDYSIYSTPTVLAGDFVAEIRLVYYALMRPADTAYVEHFFRRGNKSVGATSYSCDAAGKRPVPLGWHPTR
jgi:hypothetical protein